jgi:predicted Zn-dependent protease
LARKYFYQNEYEKALPYYKKLCKKHPKRDYFTKQYIECLDKLGQQEKAINFLKKKLKKKEIRPHFWVSLGYLYSQQGNTKLQKRSFKKAKEKGIKNPIYLNSIANEFMRKRFPTEATELYVAAYKETKDSQYLLRIGDIHKAYGNYSEMITTYLQYLDEKPYDIQVIKNKLQAALEKDKEEVIANQLKKSLIRRVQEYPRKTYFSDLLLWFSIQKKDFPMAYTQARALDKRLKEDGERVLHLAKICSKNKDYATTIKATDYILKKGKEYPYYFDALSTKIQANYQKIIETPSPLQEDILNLERELQNILNEFGRNSNTIFLAKTLSHLQTFYLDKNQEAITSLEKAIKYRGLNKLEKAELKMELADEYLYTGEVWESTLLYSQIEKALPQSPIAAEAKYRNAKLSFYIGEFDWAKTQLLVLKASTSKLIANDALYLSLLINENMDADTASQALKYFGKASFLLFQNKPDFALKTLDSIFSVAFFHPMFDDALLQKAKIYLTQHNFVQAEKTLSKLTDDYSHEITTDDALWLLATLHENELKDLEKAKNSYFKIIKNHPDSIYAEEARGRYRALRGDDK